MRIVVLDGATLNPGDLLWDSVSRLGEFTVYDRTSPDQTLARAADADILLTNKTRLTAETIAALPKLKYVAALATGYNVVDVAAARRRGIPVSNVPVYGTDSVAQFALASGRTICASQATSARCAGRITTTDIPDSRHPRSNSSSTASLSSSVSATTAVQPSPSAPMGPCR